MTNPKSGSHRYLHTFLLWQVKTYGGKWRRNEGPDLGELIKLEGWGYVKRTLPYGRVKHVQWNLTAKGELALRKGTQLQRPKERIS